MRSSAAEYLTFITAPGESDANAIYYDENVWLSQKTMGLLYNVETHTINLVYSKDSIGETAFPQSEKLPVTKEGRKFYLGWSHYIILMRISDIHG